MFRDKEIVDTLNEIDKKLNTLTVATLMALVVDM